MLVEKFEALRSCKHFDYKVIAGGKHCSTISYLTPTFAKSRANYQHRSERKFVQIRSTSAMSRKRTLVPHQISAHVCVVFQVRPLDFLLPAHSSRGRRQHELTALRNLERQ